MNQIVYNSLITSKIKTLYTKETNVITKTKVTPDLLNKLTSDLQKTKQILLLEHSFTNDQNYVKDIIFETNTLPFSNTFTEIIPDILSLEYFNPSDNENEIIMTSNGLYFQKLKSTKIGITIFDIKSTLPDNVGKHNFIEIIYYISALYYYLKNNNLTDTYFIRSDNHGILPSYIDIFQKIKDNTHPNIDSFSSLFELIILFQPIHYQNIFLTFLEKIRSFWSNAPLQKKN